MGNKLTFVDVETTGLHSSDRIVSIAAIAVDEDDLRFGKYDAQMGHFIVDPGRKSHPKAEEVHGYDDWLLRHQLPFADIAATVRPLLEGRDSLIAHNAAFDGRFVLAEFEALGSPIVGVQLHCTMQEYRSKYEGRAGLDAILTRIGLARASRAHSALEDAWLTMQVYCWMRGYPMASTPSEILERPTNLSEPPPHPGYPLPRRSRKKAAAVHPVEKVWTTKQTQALTLAAEPIATLMAALAMADGNLDATEAAVLTEYISEERERVGIPPDAIGEMDIAAGFCERTASEHTLRLCARTVMENTEKRERLSAWLKRIAYADGGMSEPESRALRAITAAFADVKT